MATQLQKIFFLLPAILFCGALNAQCSSTGAFGGSVFTNITSVGTLAWATPANAQVSDNQDAIISKYVTPLNSPVVGNYLNAVGFGFSVPSSATICGIEVNIQHRSPGKTAGTLVQDNIVKLVQGGVIGGNNLASVSDWAVNYQVFTYGNASELWGMTWTPADINSPNFGIAISTIINSGINSLTLTSQIDYISITVYYNNFVLPIELTDFVAEKTGNEKVDLTWKTLSEKNNNYFQVERSKDALSFEEVKTVKGAGNSIQTTQYAFSDENPYAGISYYRLKQVDYNGAFTYSDIRLVTDKESAALAVYPVPASDKLYIQMPVRNDAEFEIELINTAGQKIKSYKQNMKAGNNEIQLNLDDVEGGLYLLKVGFLSEMHLNKLLVIK